MECKSATSLSGRILNFVLVLGLVLAAGAARTWAQSPNTVLLERWNGISGTAVSDLTNNSAYPNSPSTRTYPNIFEIPTNVADNYGTRIRGYVTPPTTGTYSFWIAGDDNCELWFSTNDNPASATRIAFVSSWTDSRQWTKFAEQHSANFTLTAGTRYYIETRQKEGGGGDNLAVGWQGPGITGDAERPIPGSRLSPFLLVTPPAITTQPANVTVNQGQTATFSVTATGTSLAYQWRRNGTNISGATSASYTTPATVGGDNGAQFSVVVSNSAGTVTSSNAVLTVIVPPAITTQPAAATVAVGQTATFSVVATGTSPAYQWRRNGANISGATSASYTTPAATASDNGVQFSVVVSNAAGSVTSANALLTVTSAPVITTQPANAAVAVGATATFSVVATGTAPLSYQWRRNGVSITGANAASYTTPPTTGTDSGAQFSVVVSNSQGSVTSANAQLTILTPPRIVTQPVNSTVNSGQTATFSVVAAGSPTLTYQWRRNGTNISGATSASYTTPATVPGDNGAQFSVVVSNAVGSVTSSNATLIVLFTIPNNRKLAISGELVDASGNPLGYPTPVTVSAIVTLFDAATGGLNRYTEDFRAGAGRGIRVENGLFVARLGDGVTTQNLQTVLSTIPSLWAEITIDDGTPEVLLPRTPVTGAPYAIGGIPTGVAPAALSGAGNPNTLNVEAAVGASYVNTLDNSTWYKLNSAWKLMD